MHIRRFVTLRVREFQKYTYTLHLPIPIFMIYERSYVTTLYKTCPRRVRVWQYLLGLADTRVINKIASTRRRRNLHEDRAC